jgi:hypothetical protein
MTNALSKKYKKVSIVPTKMSSFLYLKEDDFDTKGDIYFHGHKLNRGGWPYIQPEKGFIRVGLKVTGRYDGGDDTWLASDAKG